MDRLEWCYMVAEAGNVKFGFSGSKVPGIGGRGKALVVAKCRLQGVIQSFGVGEATVYPNASRTDPAEQRWRLGSLMEGPKF